MSNQRNVKSERTDDRPDPNGSQSLSAGEVFRRLGPAAWLGILWASAPAIMGILLLSSIGPISDWLLAHPRQGLSIYVAVFIVSAGAGLLPTYAQAIVGGWVFGFVPGSLAALAGFTGACIVGRVIARLASQDRVEKMVADHPKAAVIREALVGRGLLATTLVVTLVRVPPNSPFALTNLLLSSVGVKWLPYVVGTAVGMAPRTIIACYLASAAMKSGARDIQALISNGPGLAVLIGGFVAMLIVLGIIGAIANRALARLHTRPGRNGA